MQQIGQPSGLDDTVKHIRGLVGQRNPVNPNERGVEQPLEHRLRDFRSGGASGNRLPALRSSWHPPPPRFPDPESASESKSEPESPPSFTSSHPHPLRQSCDLPPGP
uniref:CAMK/CAMKL/KIN4 protein kinase n=1 Tax=Ganoderma boninense TaxID=34458 RepID=A0A5K1JYW1_9APHY|nr:CAMK/CAMKL/KIN4 protein kinase [Ganoderma boninense]